MSRRNRGRRDPDGDPVTQPPKAPRRPHEIVYHGHVRVDPYYWLKDRDDPEVIAYLEAENAYTQAMLAHTEELQEKLFAEIKARIKETDQSVPYKLDDYFYYTRFEEGRQYPIHCRKRESLDHPEEVMVDANELAAGLDYFSLASLQVSFNQDVAAYCVDTVGRRIYTIYFKDLGSGELLADVIPEVTGNLAWANDDTTLFYSKHDPVTLRSHRIYRHVLGTDPAADVLVYEEEDEAFRTYVFRTKSKRYLVIGARQTLSTEYRFLDAADPTGTFTMIEPRRRAHEYAVEHYGDHFYVRTNDGAKNYRMMRAPVASPGRASWEEMIPLRDDVLFEGFELFRDHYVVCERRDGLVQLRVLRWDGGGEHELDFGEPAYMAAFGINPDFDTEVLRFGYASLTTPPSTYDYNLRTREKTLLKREEVLGGFDPADYRTERLHARADDGVEVPISLVYRRDLVRRDGASPLLLTGYGAYGFSRDASFSSARLSLLGRGFVFAIAHVRGGEELGRGWYEDGRLLRKKNTFTDFIACAEHLVAEKYADPKRVYAQGGSAGGLLVGAVVNMRPDLFHGVLAAVPFVDVVTTMLDVTIPLTTFEYDEWGDPRVRELYEYILSYSPYDNVVARDYPHMLVTTGLHDSQVQFWEPAKWVAKLRATKTDRNRLLLKTHLEAGHHGPSGRYEVYREVALQFAFLLDLAGLADVAPAPSRRLT